MRHSSRLTFFSADFLTAILDFSVCLRHRSAASSARSTLLGEAGWHRADSQKPELSTISEQYDDSSDSARFNRPGWVAEWCTWLAQWWRISPRKFTIRQRSAPQTSVEQRIVAADGH